MVCEVSNSSIAAAQAQQKSFVEAALVRGVSAGVGWSKRANGTNGNVLRSASFLCYT